MYLYTYVITVIYQNKNIVMTYTRGHKMMLI